MLLAIFVDNVKDDAYRTNNVSFRAILADGGRKEIHNQIVEAVGYLFIDNVWTFLLESQWLDQLLYCWNFSNSNPTQGSQPCSTNSSSKTNILISCLFFVLACGPRFSTERNCWCHATINFSSAILQPHTTGCIHFVPSNLSTGYFKVYNFYFMLI